MVKNTIVLPPLVISDFFTDRTSTLFPILAISIILGLFLDYVILTQSKSLGTFKYYVLNQSIWAQLFEVLMILLNPVFLTPYFAGYMGGIFRNTAGYAATSAVSALCFSLFFNNILGTILSLVNRYILTFHPEWRKYLENKITISVIVAFHVFMYAMDVYFYFTAPENSDVGRNMAINETKNALKKYYNEPTFIYSSEQGGEARKIWIILFAIVFGLSFILLTSAAIFIRNVLVFRRKKGVVSRTSFYLLISAVVQVVLCVVFLFIPIGWLALAYALNIQNRANLTNGLIMLVSIYGTVDTITTLYFIMPYRKFCLRLIGQNLRSRKISMTSQELLFTTRNK
uniref:Serpentine Receptor, class J n=1 Tax=Panagrellus redivivus TaxID=6233 RepID=A0A7E4ZSE9_PANRE